MSYELKGIYIDLLAWSWDNGPLPKSESARARLLGLTGAKFRKAWRELASKWHEIDLGFINIRLETLRGEREEFVAKSSDLGKTGAKTRWANRDKAEISVISDGSPVSDLPSPSPKDQERSADDGFQAFWAIYPNHKSKDKAMKAWRRLNPSAALQADIANALAWQRKTPKWVKDGGEFIPYASSYLNGRRWEDEPDPAVRPRTLGPDYDAADWREECARLHNNRCTNAFFHRAQMEAAS